MKIYTKTGDTGETSLIGGKRVKKSCLEIEAIGEVDELNAALGILASLLAAAKVDSRHNARLQQTQHRLFVIGANLAAVQMSLGQVPKLTTSDVADMEDWIDEMDKDLPTLKQFILPAGAPAAAQAFFVRAVCRRAERQVVAVRERYPALDPLVPQYLNRLSDLLFVLARWLNWKLGAAEVEWQK